MPDRYRHGFLRLLGLRHPGLPVTGVPLPLVSYGGISVIVLLFATGILLNIAAKTPARAQHATTKVKT